MTDPAFAAYLRHHAHPAWCPDSDPSVEMHDGTVRIFDQRGESCSLKQPFPRQLRALAKMLEMCADEIERRGFEKGKSR